MADHLDAPGLMPPGGDASIDITDVYVFKKRDAAKSILMLNVNPLAPTLASAFNPDALYELKVDTDGDFHPDIAFRIKFSPVVDGRQRATVRRATGEMARGNDNTGEVIISGARVSFGATARITDSDSFRFFAGKRSDPFFFDLAWFLGGLPKPRPATGPLSTPADFFAKANVFGIVLEVPNSALGANNHVAIWGRTLLPSDDGLSQVERMGRPAINTVFMKGNKKNAFNRGRPHTDRERFTDEVVGVLTTLGGALGGTSYDAATASAIAGILLPDFLTYNYNSSFGFVPSDGLETGLNGRKLRDDVIDFELGLVTNGARTTDGVGRHRDLLSVFPFLGVPH